MRYAETFSVYIDLETTAGHRYLQYRPVNTNQLGAGEYVFYGLGTGAMDGHWHTFMRDLQADLEAAQPGVVINEVNGFLIRGSGMVDDIKMLDEFNLPSETLCFNGIDDDGDRVMDCADFDCTGAIGAQTTCGFGACAGNTGNIICQGGNQVNNCNPLAGATREVCGDSSDNDCDGSTDCDAADCAMYC